MKSGSSPDLEPTLPLEPNKADHILSISAWLVALCLVALALILAWRAYNGLLLMPEVLRSPSNRPALPGVNTGSPLRLGASINLPEMAMSDPDTPTSIVRNSSLQTIIPSRPRQVISTYAVDEGDSVFEIARKFNLTPETVLWGNYAVLNDNPHLISIGMELNISPVDGVLYEFQDGDTIEAVAAF